MPTVIIADDHPIVLEGMRFFLQKSNINIICACPNGVEAYNQVLLRRPDIAILDMSMPGMNGIEIAEALLKKKCRTKLVLLTMHNESSIINRARSLGVKGYVLKEHAMDEIGKCIAEVAAGGEYFSPSLIKNILVTDTGYSEAEGLGLLTFAEKKIVSLIAAQKSTKEIAAQLFIAEKTVETHRRNIISKLNLPPDGKSLILWAAKNIKVGES